MVSAQAAAQIPRFLVVLPAINACLVRVQADAVPANRILAISLSFCHVLGSMGLWPTARVFIYGMLYILSCRQSTDWAFLAAMLDTLRCGYAATLRFVLTYLAVGEQISPLFTGVAVLDGTAYMIFPPLLQKVLSRALSVGGLAVSTPFFVVAAS